MQMRPCWAEINLSSLADNYRYLAAQATSQVELIAVIKANAYGHGLALCAPAVINAGAKWLGVTSVEEGVAARAASPQARILIMGGVFPGQGAAVVAHNLTPSVWEPWQFAEVENAARAAATTVAVHLEMDTGMSRQGVNPVELEATLQSLRNHAWLRVEAVMTHLFAADETCGDANTQQLDALSNAITTLKSFDLMPEFLSVGSSATLLSKYARIITTLAQRHHMKPMLRSGLALYGVVPEFAPTDSTEAATARQHLKPVLTWKTKVATVRSIPAGSLVGYNGTFLATEPMRLALLPLGYADGYSRQLSNCFSVLIRGQHAPIAGRISMDQAVVDITEIDGVQTGDEVVILGTHGDESITAYDLAKACNTIPWEIFTSIAPRVTRIAV